MAIDTRSHCPGVAGINRPALAKKVADGPAARSGVTGLWERLFCDVFNTGRPCETCGGSRSRSARSTRSAYRTGWPRRSRLGLGLVDSMLALVVMIVLGTMVGHVFSGWVERRISQAEARVLSAWADAGALWLLQNRSEINKAARPREITGSVRVTAGAASTAGAAAYGVGGLTPHRNRRIRLWVRNGSAGRAQLLAVASSGTPANGDFVPVPTAGDGIVGVGMARAWKGRTSVIGPAVHFNLRPWLRQNPAVAAIGDMVAVREVSADTGDPYLHRARVKGRPELNRMQTNLTMGGHSIIGAGRVEAREVVTTRIDGPLTVRGGLAVNGAMSVDPSRASGSGSGANAGGGGISMPSATITGNLKAGTVTAADVDARTINAKNARIGDLTVTGGCSGC